MGRIEIRLVIWFLALMACADAVRAADHPAVVTSAELCDRLTALQKRVSAWYIEYEVAPDREKPPAEQYRIHRIVAGKWPDHYCHWNAKAMDAYGWEDDPLQQRLVINGGLVTNEYVWNRAFLTIPIDKTASLPGTAPQELLFPVLGLWPFENRPAPITPDGTPSVFAEVVRSGRYVMEPQQEQVDGHWCHVLTYPGHDRLWFDCNRGCTLMKREISNSKSGRLAQRSTLWDHVEVDRGIWFPTAFRTVIYGNGADPQDRNTHPVVDAQVRILATKINDAVPASLFNFSPRAGTVELFADHAEPRVPGGEDHIEYLASWIPKHRWAASASRGSGLGKLEAAVEYGIVAASLLLMLVGGFGREAQIPIEGSRSEESMASS